MTSEAAGLKEWVAGLQLGDPIAVLYDDEPGAVLIQRVQAIVEPGEPFGDGVAQERYVAGLLDFFDGRGRGWRVDYADDESERLVVSDARCSVEPPTAEKHFRDRALEVLEVGGVEWGRLTEAQLRQFLGWLSDADAIPPEFLGLEV